MPSDMSPGVDPHEQGQHPGAVPGGRIGATSSNLVHSANDTWKPGPVAGIVALLIALIALAVGVIGWFHPTPHIGQLSSKPTYTQQQVAEAKAKVGAAFGHVDRAVGIATALPSGGDALVTAPLNIRQVFDVGSRNILTTLAEQPAAPADLATAIRKQANTLEEAVIGYQYGFWNADPELRPVVDANTATALTIRQLCK
jgi:hypothetical protein